MRLVLVGPGALGSLFAVRLGPYLQEEGDTLFLLDHNTRRARQLTENGLSLQHGQQLFTFSPRVVSDPSHIPACDVLLLCVKAGQVQQALDHASPLITADTLVVGMQNGMAHLAALEKTAGIAVGATSSEGATLNAPGHVIYGGAGLTRFGLLAPSPTAPAHLDILTQRFTLAGLQAERVDDILVYLWEKLFINVAINALTAIHGRENGWLLTSEHMKATMKEAVLEAVAVADAKNIPHSTDPLEQAFTVCHKTAENVSSMLQDIRKKRPTEIDAINGYIVREGTKLGIRTPVNQNLVNQVLAIQSSWNTG